MVTDRMQEVLILKNIVDAQWLLDNFNNDRLVLLDCRFDLNDREYGEKEYKKSHIKGAYYVDLEKDLTGNKKEHGGRHPLPEIDKFIERMQSLGINNNSIIVIYDDGDLPAASRLWWMLKYIGMDRVYVLESGFNQWKKKGLETTDEIPMVRSNGKLDINIQSHMICDIKAVKESMGNKNAVIIDSRAKDRYLGIVEPIDKRGGHIPGALNYFWKDIFNDNKIKNEKELRLKFKELSEYEKIIIHCGSGITACPNIIAMDEIGIKPVLYLGGWSDWVSYDENQAIKGE